jgi:hypothetical protein
MFAISSILNVGEVDIIALLKQPIHEKKADPHVYVMIMFVTIYYATSHIPNRVYRLYMILLGYMVRSNAFGIGRISAPIIREAASTTVSGKHAAISLYRAALEYRELGLMKNSLIDFWRSYNYVWMNCWPRIAHSLLLEIASFGQPPDKLLNILTHRTLSFVPQTIEQLRRMELTSVVFIESVIVHNLTLSVTGFPSSPAPKLMSALTWATLRKRLFPVAYHPSTEQFANESWTTDTSISAFTVAVGETYQISFRLTTTLEDGCHMSQLRLYIEPEDAAETLVVDSCLLRETTEFVMTFTPVRPVKFQVRGLRFQFFDVAPVAVTFPQPVRYHAIAKEALLSLSLVSRPDISYTNIPFRFSALAARIRGSLHDQTYAFLQTAPHHPSMKLVSPSVPGSFNKFALPAFENELLLEFEMVPACEGRLEVSVLVGYSSMNHGQRFAVASFSIDVLGMRRIHIHPANDCVVLSHIDDVRAISCASAAIHTAKNVVFFDDVTADSYEKKCTIEIEREVLGTIVRDSLPLTRVFARFDPAEIIVERFPAVIEWRFQLLCLGANDGRLLLKSPPSLEWCWVGKTRYTLRGPQRLAVAAGLLVTGPVQFDVCSFLSVIYGNETRSFHHAISVHQA